MSNLADVIIWLSIAYALLGVLLLVICIFARIPWPVKAAAIVLTSAFYVVSFFATRGLLGWSSTDPLPPKFKLLAARIVEPHSLEGDPGAIHLWVEALDDDNFPSGVPRAYRLPYDAHLAERTEAAIRASANGVPQGGRTRTSAAAKAETRKRLRAKPRRRRSSRQAAEIHRPAVRSTRSWINNRTRPSILRRSPRHACLRRTRNSSAIEAAASRYVRRSTLIRSSRRIRGRRIAT